MEERPGDGVRRSIVPIWLGTRRYQPVHDFMQALVDARHHGRAPDILLLLEHEPVITLGRAAKRAHVLLSESERSARGIDFVETGRGGDVTFHGPGQLVAYPIIDLKPDRCDVRKYVADLTRVMEGISRRYGVDTGRVSGQVGAWVDRSSPNRWQGEDAAMDLAKIGAIGVRISRWITMHGFALNVSTDLAGFQFIVPCGIADHGVTSIASLVGKAPPVVDVAAASLPIFADVFGASLGTLIDAEDRELTFEALGVR